MIDNERQARLIDFGSSHFLDDFDAVKDLEGFSLRWCAPELLKPGAISTPSSDVYAFASTMLEVGSKHSLAYIIILIYYLLAAPHRTFSLRVST